MPKDVLGREVRTGDYVVYHSRVYEVKEANNRSSVSIELAEPHTSRPIRKQANATCLVSKGDVMIWLLKKDSK